MPSRRPRRKFGPSQKDRLFFACLPDVETAARIHDFAEAQKTRHGLEGPLILPEHLHVTLFHLGDWAELPEPIVKLARAAAAAVRLDPFDVVFDRVGSFRNRTGIYPFVLTGEKHIAAWMPLHDALAAALKERGLGGATRGEFQPHMTLTRDKKRVTTSGVTPFSWRVREVVLIHSLLGKTTHVHLDRWILGTESV
jgi:2'-5' RNA ligase